MAVGVARRAINLVLAANLVLLVCLGAVSEIALNVYGLRDGYGLVKMANLSFEGNLPTWYSSLLLAACAAALILIAHLGAKEGAAHLWHWRALAVIFLYISLDEAVIIHETFNSPLRTALELQGVFYFAWVVPVAALLAVFLLAYLRFLKSLPRRSRLLFILAGAVYVGGALGTELPISAWYERHGGDNIGYGLLNLAQESLEILGASIFLSALIDYLGRAFGVVTVRFVGSCGQLRPACGQPTR